MSQQRSDVSPGFLSIDKPAGITSRDVVDRVAKLVGCKRVGHAGTLDPFATGVLIVAVGKATQLIEYVQRMRKTYIADVLLGSSSDTDDREGARRAWPNAVAPSKADLAAAIGAFVGVIAQRPPAYSAVHVDGQRAHKLARRGDAVELPPRPVVVHEIAIQRFEYPRLRLLIHCGGGVYIRAIARDLGERLRTGGLLEELARTAIGTFRREEAVNLSTLSPENWRRSLRPPEAALAELPMLNATDEQLQKLAWGQTIVHDGCSERNEDVAMVDGSGRLHVIGRAAEGRVAPHKGGFAMTVHQEVSRSTGERDNGASASCAERADPMP